MDTDSMISIFTSPAATAALGSIVSAIAGALIDRYLGAKIKKMLAKPITVNTTIKFSISKEQIMNFSLKYLVPLFFIIYLMSADVIVDRWFVLSIAICFSVMTVSLIRDAALYYFYKLIEGLKPDRKIN